MHKQYLSRDKMFNHHRLINHTNTEQIRHRTLINVIAIDQNGLHPDHELLFEH